ncbi:MAG: hypothetical protein NVSMB17_04890 [Candidatus Dormibacteria bacterium]
MTHKLLPLPLGGHAPRGSSVRFWHQYKFRYRLESLALLCGLALAAAGAWMGLHPEPIRVRVDVRGYHVGKTVIAAVDGARYNGDVAIAIRREDGQVRAAAAGLLAGREMQGLCVMASGAGAEECIFIVDRRSFQAHDSLGHSGWNRRYDDGTEVEIELADLANPVPVPLPLGHN